MLRLAPPPPSLSPSLTFSLFVSLSCDRQIILTLAIGTTVLGGYMYYRFENTLSFEYTGVADEKKAAEALAGENSCSSLLCLLLVVALMR